MLNTTQMLKDVCVCVCMRTGGQTKTGGHIHEASVSRKACWGGGCTGEMAAVAITSWT